MLYEGKGLLVGNTPLVKLTKYENNIYCKLEKNNLTGSIKDRAGKEIIEGLIKEKKIKINDTIVCTTSGNLGISLAYFCKQYNLRLILIMPNNVSIERIKLIKLLNGKVILVKERDYDKLNKIGLNLSKKFSGYFINQFDCKYNILAGFKLGKELNKELEKIDFIICGIGSGGTYQGLKDYFKNSNTKVFGILPKVLDHHITGIGAGFTPQNIKKLEDIIFIDEEHAFSEQQKFINEEGLFIGKSSGAVVSGCKTLIYQEDLVNKNIVLIFPDSVERYLSE